jgi:hypothetical protein
MSNNSTDNIKNIPNVTLHSRNSLQQQRNVLWEVRTADISREDCAADHVVPVATWVSLLGGRTSRRRDLASTEGVVQNQRRHDARGGAWPRRSYTGGRGYTRRRSRIESRGKTCVFLTLGGPEIESRGKTCVFLALGGSEIESRARHACSLNREAGKDVCPRAISITEMFLARGPDTRSLAFQGSEDETREGILVTGDGCPWVWTPMNIYVNLMFECPNTKRLGREKWKILGSYPEQNIFHIFHSI